MDVIRQQRPGGGAERPRVGEPGEAVHEVLPAPLIAKDRAALQAPDHHMVQDAGGIETGPARHAGTYEHSLLYLAGSPTRTRGHPIDREARILVKTFRVGTAMAVTQAAVEIFGGSGPMKKGPVEKHLRDAAVFIHLRASRAHRLRAMNHLMDRASGIPAAALAC